VALRAAIPLVADGAPAQVAGGSHGAASLRGLPFAWMIAGRAHRR
jgi:hypothetical protein